MSGFNPFRGRFIGVCAVVSVILAMSVTIGVCQEAAPKAAAEEPPVKVPSLADVVYKTGVLEQQLTDLKTKIDLNNGLKALSEQLAETKERIKEYKKRMSALNTEDLQSYQQLVALKSEVRSEWDAFSRVVSTLKDTIKKAESWRRQWEAEKKQWEQWRSVLGDDVSLKSVRAAFSQSRRDIGEALNLISRKLEPLLAVQKKAGDIGARLDVLMDEINAMMGNLGGGNLRGGTPTMFSMAYMRQLIDLALEPAKSIKALPMPDEAFFSKNGWVIALQVLVFIVLLAVLEHHRPQLLDHPHRWFLGKRCISVSLFVSIFTLTFLYGPQPAIWRMLIQTLAAVAATRLVASFVHESWIRRAIYILVPVVIVFQLLLALGIHLSVMRLFILIWAVAGLLYYVWRVRKDRVAGKPAWYLWFLRLVVLVFFLIAVTDFIGLGGFSVQLMDGTIRTAVYLLMGWAMIRLASVGLEFGIELLPAEPLALLHINTQLVLNRTIFVCNALIVTFVAAQLLVAWKLYAIPIEAFHSIFSFGVTVGGQKITLAVMLVAGAILYGAFVLSWGLQTILMENVLSRRQMDHGIRMSIARLVHYGLVLVGFIMALSAMGFELKNVTIIGGALGVGIGFGMQTIVNNFVCGLIMLFERPIKIGDVIQLTDGQQGRVLNLGLRATTIQTFDRAEIVVPNNDLIAGQVVNWTLGDRTVRLVIPVGVAYGSDVETVIRVLREVAIQSHRVLKDPQPMVLFLNFGDSSLDFQLRVWIADFNDRRVIQSDLVRDIDRRFRAEGIEIPFPQRDLHLRSVDDRAAERLTDRQPSARPQADDIPPLDTSAAQSD